MPRLFRRRARHRQHDTATRITKDTAAPGSLASAAGKIPVAITIANQP
jgi:hypothetical protein